MLPFLLACLMFVPLSERPHGFSHGLSRRDCELSKVAFRSAKVACAPANAGIRVALLSRSERRLSLFYGLKSHVAFGHERLTFVKTQDNSSTDSTGKELANETRLIAGLRERRLFDLAENHANQLLSRPNLSATESATLTIERIKTFTAKGILTADQKRAESWISAHDVVTQFRQKNPNHPRLLLVRIQAGLAHLAHGQLLRQEIAAELASPEAKDSALKELQSAHSQLSEIQRDIQKLVPLQRNRKLTEHELSVEELLKLTNNVRLQLAITNINRAQLYAQDDRLNRIDVLSGVLDRLSEVQRETTPNQPIWWETQAMLIECMRLLHRLPEAGAVEEKVAVSAEEQPNLALDSWVEQNLLLALETADERRGTKYLILAEEIENRSPMLDLARLKVAMDFSLRAVPPGKSEWLSRSAQLARNIEGQHGPYWGRRAKLVLIGEQSSRAVVNNSGSDSGSNDNRNGNSAAVNSEASAAQLDLLAGIAEQAERQEKWSDALKAYDRAASVATEIKAVPQAFSFAVRAAQVFEKQQKQKEAAERFFDLANKDRDHELAHTAHLRGCWNWSRLLAKKEPEPENQQQYLQRLEEHLKYWPKQESANQIRVWLGGQIQSSAKTSDQWKSCFATFMDVEPQSSLFTTAIQQAGYCARQWIANVEASQKELAAKEMIERINKQLAGCTPESTSHQQTFLLMSEMAVRFGSVDLPSLVEPLRSLISSIQDQSLPTRKQAQAWLYAIQAFEPTAAETMQATLAGIADDKSALSMAEQGMAAILLRRPQSANETSRNSRLALIEMVLNQHGKSLNNQERVAWLFRKGDVLAELGKSKEAFTIFGELEKELPNDAGIKLRIARAMTRMDSEKDRADALSKWRQLATQIKPHTAGWYEAKYNVALLLEKSGEKEEAKKMLEYLKAIPPGWENSTLKDDFEKVLKRVK